MLFMKIVAWIFMPFLYVVDMLLNRYGIDVGFPVIATIILLIAIQIAYWFSLFFIIVSTLLR